MSAIAGFVRIPPVVWGAAEKRGCGRRDTPSRATPLLYIPVRTRTGLRVFLCAASDNPSARARVGRPRVASPRLVLEGGRFGCALVRPRAQEPAPQKVQSREGRPLSYLFSSSEQGEPFGLR